MKLRTFGDARTVAMRAQFSRTRVLPPGLSLSNPVDSDSPNLGRDVLSAAPRSARPSTSAFHIGWRELNVGAWISRIQPKEYEMRATGWVRVAAGLQSLLSVYLIALWTLTYFGRPFQ
jgi:hypothetical protein